MRPIFSSPYPTELTTRKETEHYHYEVRTPKSIASVAPALATLPSAIDTLRSVMRRGFRGQFYEAGRQIITPTLSDPTAAIPGVHAAAGLNYFLAAPDANPPLTEYYRNFADVETPSDEAVQRHLLAGYIYGESSGANITNVESGQSDFCDIFVCGEAPGTEHVYTVGDNDCHTHWVNGEAKMSGLPFRHLSHVYEGLMTSEYVAAVDQFAAIFEDRPAGQHNVYFDGQQDDGSMLRAPTLLGFADTIDGQGLLEISIHSYPNPAGRNHEIVLALTHLKLTRGKIKGLFG